jgi:PAS domain
MDYNNFDITKSASLCDAPLKPSSRDQLPQDHPAALFEEYWLGLNSGSLPQRQSFDPNQVKPLLRWIIIFEEGDGQHAGDYLVRLHGTTMTQMMHGDHTGDYLTDFIDSSCIAGRLDAMATTIREGQPTFGKAVLGEDSEYRYEVLIGVFPFLCAEGKYQIFMVGAPGNPRLFSLF